jgi:hypothetical protein
MPSAQAKADAGRRLFSLTPRKRQPTAGRIPRPFRMAPDPLASDSFLTWSVPLMAGGAKE